jgi:predicted enzyme related to lactoylglutathione lyase
MTLSRYPLNASVAVSDMDRARAFYEGQLGLSAETSGADGSRIYGSGGGASLHVYPSPPTAGKTPATLATWYVDDMDQVVGELESAGVSLARYEGLEADERGIAPRAGGGRVAWIKDPDGNTFALEADD